jgi:hypothetical protein
VVSAILASHLLADFWEKTKDQHMLAIWAVDAGHGRINIL